MTFELYIDDSGSRKPDHTPTNTGEMNAFGLGGILIAEENTEELKELHKEIITKYSITAPLHSSKIRCMKGDFRWLAKDQKRAEDFYEDLNQLITTMPALATACIINRPGYNKRYEEIYGTNRWHLCKTAYSILIERCAKYAMLHDRKLRVFIERTGRKEDNKIREYHSELITKSAPFDNNSSAKYAPLQASDFESVLMKNPKFVQKQNRLVQLADLVLYPLIKGKYNPDYKPYQVLLNENKILKVQNKKGEITLDGVKYSCFD